MKRTYKNDLITIVIVNVLCILAIHFIPIPDVIAIIIGGVGALTPIYLGLTYDDYREE